MGKVRPERVKKLAREMLKRQPDRFSTDFDNNKKVLDSIARIYSAKLRNQIAGYITRLVAISKTAEAEEATKEGGAVEGEE